MIFMKYYAVKKGRKTGIFTSWDEAEKKVKGFSGAQYKSFKTEAEANAYLNGAKKTTPPTQPHHKSHKKASTGRRSVQPDGDIIVYTDGGSRNHGNHRGGHVKASDKAAWAFLVQTGSQKYFESGGEFGATNNRMEIMAFLEALKYLKRQGLQNERIGVVMDSQYVLDAIQKGWLAGWRRRGWNKSDGSKLHNKQLWQAVDANLRDFPIIRYYWTKGHAGDEGNVFVDHLLNQTMDQMGQLDPQASPAVTPDKPDPQPIPKPQPTKQQPTPRQPKPIHRKAAPTTPTSVQDIKNSLKQLGLFDEDDD
ncbi:ribonuclease H [Lentilactobacillus buchneri DSM 20057]|nr:ribonuclease H [Lentilactobacillus buchneri DSM 20057]